MASYTVAAADGATTVRNQDSVSALFHHFELRGNGTATAGTVKIQARRPGAEDSHLVDVGTYDFSSPSHIDHIGPVSDWVFTSDSIAGVSLFYVTITSTATGKDDGGGVSPADKAKLDAITSTGSGEIITNAERSKLSNITDIGSGEIIKTVERTKLSGITDLGSGKIITDDERKKLNESSFMADEDQLLEGLALGSLYAKQVQVG